MKHILASEEGIGGERLDVNDESVVYYDSIVSLDRTACRKTISPADDC